MHIDVSVLTSRIFKTIGSLDLLAACEASFPCKRTYAVSQLILLQKSETSSWDLDGGDQAFSSGENALEFRD